MSTSKENYLTKPIVHRFVIFISQLILGRAHFEHTLNISDRRLPKTHTAYFAKKLTIKSLKEAFEHYWWDGKNYEENQRVLAPIRSMLRSSIELETGDSKLAQQAALDVLDKVLEWGAGGRGAALYRANMAWAQSQYSVLVDSLRLGRTSMDSDNPDLSVFCEKLNQPYARMNAGFTKYYALACRDLVIYDGRVGAALCYLVRLFCLSEEIASVPNELAFRWDPGRGGRNRNPSVGSFRFRRLSTGGDRFWAESNIRANWILRAAVDLSRKQGADWCGTDDELRRIEAALFVIGYEIPSVE